MKTNITRKNNSSIVFSFLEFINLYHWNMVNNR